MEIAFAEDGLHVAAGVVEEEVVREVDRVLRKSELVVALDKLA